MGDGLTIVALVCGAVSIALLVLMVFSLRKRRVVGSLVSLILALVVLSWAGLLGAVGMGIQGYRALTHEELAAVVTTEPLGPQRFAARFSFPDGRTEHYELAGDQLYVDAQILKWKPMANMLGLHTAYRLDRVAGRYLSIDDERKRQHSVHALGDAGPIDLFSLRRKYEVLSPLVDAEYGSASYVTTDHAQRFEVRVSTTGLLIRRHDNP